MSSPKPAVMSISIINIDVPKIIFVLLTWYVADLYSDVDECGENADICGGGRCENEAGGYRCICTDGLELSEDLITCRGMDEQFCVITL